MLKCSKCGKVKNESAFDKSRTIKRGYQYVCKACRKDYAKQPEIKRKLKQYRQQYCEQHPHLYRKYYRENPEKYRLIIDKHRRKNPNIVRIYNRIRNNPKQYPLANKCVFCGTTTNLEHGHLDYEDNGHNYVTVCHKCNYWMEIK